MAMFEYVAILTSIIIGLGIAHLLQGVARLVQHPGRERVYWVHLTWVAYMFFQSVFWWWWEFRLGDIETWTFSLYIFVIAYAVNIYLLCALLFPSDLEGYDGYEEYFFSSRRWFFGLACVSFVVDLADSAVKGLDHLMGLGPEYLVATPLQAVLLLAAAISPSRAYHRALVIGMFIYQLWWALSSFEVMV